MDNPRPHSSNRHKLCLSGVILSLGLLAIPSGPALAQSKASATTTTTTAEESSEDLRAFVRRVLQVRRVESSGDDHPRRR